MVLLVLVLLLVLLATCTSVTTGTSNQPDGSVLHNNFVVAISQAALLASLLLKVGLIFVFVCLQMSKYLLPQMIDV